jgi:hypothetical protein
MMLAVIVHHTIGKTHLTCPTASKSFSFGESAAKPAAELLRYPFPRPATRGITHSCNALPHAGRRQDRINYREAAEANR